MKSKPLTDERVRALSGDGDKTPPFRENVGSRSEGDLNRNSYRPSQMAERLATRAVVNDDGTPIAAGVENWLSQLLALTRAIEKKQLSQKTLETIRSILAGTVEVRPKPHFLTPYTTIPGIGPASAYASGDAFGIKFIIDVPRSGKFTEAILLDLDNEGATTEIWIFNKDFADTDDNSAWAPADVNLVDLQQVISIANFALANANRVGINSGLGLPYTAPEGKIYCKCVTRGTPNIAAGKSPLVRLAIDDLTGEP